MNRSIGLLVLCCAVVIGLGTIPGCPKKDTKKDTTKVTTSTEKETETKKTEDTGTKKSEAKEAKFTLTVPAEYEIEIEKKTGTFEAKATRDNFNGEITLTFNGVPKGVTLKAAPIAANKDSTTVEVTVDTTMAKARTNDVTVMGAGGELKAEAKMKFKLK